jgi:hypothetical protein
MLHHGNPGPGQLSDGRLEVGGTGDLPFGLENLNVKVRAAIGPYLETDSTRLSGPVIRVRQPNLRPVARLNPFASEVKPHFG